MELAVASSFPAWSHCLLQCWAEPAGLWRPRRRAAGREPKPSLGSTQPLPCRQSCSIPQGVGEAWSIIPFPPGRVAAKLPLTEWGGPSIVAPTTPCLQKAVTICTWL
uniref:Uncharacterized protein n=1 Tax=Crocodylus porosus TaxID=8502 RepID=A0A7M4EIV8_CROPO